MSRYVKYFIQAKRLNSRKTPLPWIPKFLEVSKEPSKPFPLIEQNQPKRIDLSKYLNIKVGDLVQVLYGCDQGKTGVIQAINTRRNTVIVEGCNMKQSFWNPRRAAGEPSIVTAELPIHITNVAILDPVIKKPTRVKCRYMMNGECVRISKLSGCAMPEPVDKSLLKSEAHKLHQTHLCNKALGGETKDIYQEKDRRHYKMLERVAKHIRHNKASSLPSPSSFMQCQNLTASRNNHNI